MSEEIEFTASERLCGMRLDAAIAEATELTRSAAAKLIESGAVRVGGSAVAKKYTVRAGDLISLELPEPEPSEALAEDIPLDVVYEDSDVIARNVELCNGSDGEVFIRKLMSFMHDHPTADFDIIY